MDEDYRAGKPGEITIRIVFADPCVLPWHALVGALKEVQAGTPIKEVLDRIVADHAVRIEDLEAELAEWGLVDQPEDEDP